MTRKPCVRPAPPILVTGTHRSGSTWVGKMLALPHTVYYLGEIFHPHDGRLTPALLPHWFLYIPADSGQAHPMYAPLNHILKMDFQWTNAGPFSSTKLKILKYTQKWWGVPRALMKDPIAILSTEWLASTFNMVVIGLIRHPAAFALSLQKQIWEFPFKELLQQPQLVDEYLADYTQAMENPPDSFLKRGALAWVCLNHVFTSHIQRHPEWHIWRFEDVCSAPVSAFREMYARTGLQFTPRIENIVCRYSDARNPVETTQNHDAIKRDSRALRNLWKQRLTPKEALDIRRITEPVSRHYYGDADW